MPACKRREDKKRAALYRPPRSCSSGLAVAVPDFKEYRHAPRGAHLIAAHTRRVLTTKGELNAFLPTTSHTHSK